MFVAALSGYDQCLVEDKTAVCIHPAVKRLDMRRYTDSGFGIDRIKCKRRCCCLNPS